MPMQLIPQPGNGDVKLTVLDNDGLEAAIINEERPSAFRVEWEVTGPFYWAYTLGNSVWRVRIGVESIGPAPELAFPPRNQPAHEVKASNFVDIDHVNKRVRWRTQINVPDDVYDADVVYKPAAALDFSLDGLVGFPLAVQVAGFSEGNVFQAREDPDEPR